MPSASPRMGVVKTSSEGMLALNITPLPGSASSPPQKSICGMRPTWKSVPVLSLLYISFLSLSSLSHRQRRLRFLLCSSQAASGPARLPGSSGG